MGNDIILSPVPVADLLNQVRNIIRDELEQQQQKDIQERLLTPQETADLLKVSKVTLWQWERDGRIKKHSIGAKTYFKYNEIMRSLDSLRKYVKPAMAK